MMGTLCGYLWHIPRACCRLWSPRYSGGPLCNHSDGYQGNINNAFAVILSLIALSLAASMSVSPRPFLVAIIFAASTSLATSIGYQTNTMVYAPGGYHFSDYTRVGGPLNLVFWAVAVLLMPIMWPF